MTDPKGILMLKSVKEVFDRHNIEFWLDWGTLLGAVRESRLIPGDHDIDICVKKKDLPKIKEVSKELPFYSFFENDLWFRIYYEEWMIGVAVIPIEEDFYQLEFLIPHHWAGRILDYMIWVFNLRKAEFKESIIPVALTKVIIKIINIIPYRIKFEQIFRVLFDKLDSTHIILRVPQKYYSSLKEIEFYGKKFKIPEKAEEYLAFKYGKDWKIPQNYVYWEDDGSIFKKFRYGEKDESFTNKTTIN